MTGEPRDELPDPMPDERLPDGWTGPPHERQGSYGYTNREAGLYVYVYVDKNLDRPLGVNLERRPGNPRHPRNGGDEVQLAATSLSCSRAAGEAEPQASVNATALGYMQLGESLDAGET